MLKLVELLKLYLAPKNWHRLLCKNNADNEDKADKKDILRKEAYYFNRHLLIIYYIQGILETET